ncbi:MAG: hypothetical protein KC416_02115 [Myxococcales bacterium]|nr:hypothetical protein [Myxococcales bacterium]
MKANYLLAALAVAFAGLFGFRAFGVGAERAIAGETRSTEVSVVTGGQAAEAPPPEHDGEGLPSESTGAGTAPAVVPSPYATGLDPLHDLLEGFPPSPTIPVGEGPESPAWRAYPPEVRNALSLIAPGGALGHALDSGAGAGDRSGEISAEELSSFQGWAAQTGYGTDPYRHFLDHGPLDSHGAAQDLIDRYMPIADTAAGRGEADQHVSDGDLRALLADDTLPFELREAAFFLLAEDAGKDECSGFSLCQVGKAWDGLWGNDRDERVATEDVSCEAIGLEGSGGCAAFLDEYHALRNAPPEALDRLRDYYAAPRLSTPVHVGYTEWDVPSGAAELSFDIEVHEDPGTGAGLYFAPVSGVAIDGNPLYLGMQTDMIDNDAGGVRRGHGFTFSRWDTLSPDDFDVAAGGYSEIGTHEGEFVGVRQPYDWSEGTYTFQLSRRDAGDGPQSHDWFDLTVIDRQTGEEVQVGSLRFERQDPNIPATLSAGPDADTTRFTSFTEVYSGNGVDPGNVRTSAIPKMDVEMTNVQTDRGGVRDIFTDYPRFPETVEVLYPHSNVHRDGDGVRMSFGDGVIQVDKAERPPNLGLGRGLGEAIGETTAKEKGHR